MADWWQSKCWRFIQTNLREIDMADIRAEQVVRDLLSFHANVLMINAAGIIASYPTKLPYQFQSPHLTGDSLVEIIEACHKANIRVMARTDFSKVRKPIYEIHPEWASLTADGEIIDYNGDIQVCVNGDYQQDYALRIIEELLTTHDFDGVFFNMGGYKTTDYSGKEYGICHCDSCKMGFREMTGMDLPTASRPDDPSWRKYRVFQRQTLANHHRKVHDFIRALRPEICIANHREFERGFNRQESNTALGRPLPHWQYSGSDNTKWAVCSHPDMVSTNTTVDFIDYPYRHVAVSPQQQALRLAQNLANGGALDWYLIGRLDNHEDRSGFEPVRRIFHHHAENEEAYHDLESKAHIVLIRDPGEDTQEYRGWYRVLAETHFLFDALTPGAAARLPLSRYNAVILPNVEKLDDGLADRLDSFVREGGRLIASGQTSFQDADGEPRPAPALQCLGIRETELRTDTRSSYVKLEDKSHFSRFDETDLVYLDGPYVRASYKGDVVPGNRLVAPHPFGPPERCYYRSMTDDPGYAVRTFGQGCAVYVPWLPGRLYHRQGYSNTSDFMADLLEGVAGLDRLGGNLSPMVEVTRFGKRDGTSDLVHLVNGSGHFGVSFFEPVPMRDVEVALLEDRTPSAVVGLVSGEAIPFSAEGERLRLIVPELTLFEAAQIRW